VTPTAPTVHRTRLHLVISTLKRAGHPMFRPARNVCINARCVCTYERLSIAPSWPPQLGQRRGDGRDDCQHDSVERRWDDWH